MTRRIQLLLGLILTVSFSVLVAWVVLQALVLRPAIRDREEVRIQQVLSAAARMEAGESMKAIERADNVDLCMRHGPASGPPTPRPGWTRMETPGGVIWKQEGGKWELGAWTGGAWVVLQEDLPIASTAGLALLFGGAIVVVLMFGLGARANRHLERAERSLARMAAGDLEHRLNDQAGTREVRRIATAVNQMAGQLRTLMDADRQRMAGLSHELRTPLTRIRIELELARQEGGNVPRLNRVENDIEAFDTMLGEMLELSRLELGGVPLLRRESLDLGGLAMLVLETEGWSDVEVHGSGFAVADSSMVARLLGNLIRNSVAHAPAARRWVNVSDGVLEVGDDGPGISVQEQEVVFQPFQRGSVSAGTGLGLAIVSEIVRVHGGTVSLSKPPGLVVRVVFPAVADADVAL